MNGGLLIVKGLQLVMLDVFCWCLVCILEYLEGACITGDLWAP